MRIKALVIVLSCLLATSLMGSWARDGWAQTHKQTEESYGVSGKEFSRQGLLADAWFQSSGEAMALYHQGYDSGREELAADLAKNPQNPAVVLDIDETILNTSPYQAFLVKSGAQYPYKYDEWIERAQAQALPGAVRFLKYADANGIDIYYVSGREVSNLAPTIENLKRVGAPQATEQHVLLTKPGEEGKDARFRRVAKTHEILLYFGDNLGDFPGFGGKSLEDRNRMTDRLEGRFGDKYIAFPNPMYGDWESALYGSREDLTEGEKTRVREQRLHSFHPQSSKTDHMPQSTGAKAMPETGGPNIPFLGTLAGIVILSLGLMGIAWPRRRSKDV